MDGWQPMYDGDEEPDNKTKKFNDNVGKILGALQLACEVITSTNDTERWQCMRVCLTALIAAGDHMMARPPDDTDEGDPPHDN